MFVFYRQVLSCVTTTHSHQNVKINTDAFITTVLILRSHSYFTQFSQQCPFIAKSRTESCITFGFQVFLISFNLKQFFFDFLWPDAFEDYKNVNIKMPLNLSFAWCFHSWFQVLHLCEMSQRWSWSWELSQVLPLFLFVLPFSGTSIFFVIFLFNNSESFSVKYLINSSITELIGGWGSKCPGNIEVVGGLGNESQWIFWVLEAAVSESPRTEIQNGPEI